MRKIIVKVDKEKATELERVNFELNFVKDIVQRVIESHPSDLELINGDTLMSYNKRGAELQRKYAALANETSTHTLYPGQESSFRLNSIKFLLSPLPDLQVLIIKHP